jgi:hypothetical protein
MCGAPVKLLPWIFLLFLDVGCTWVRKVQPICDSCIPNPALLRKPAVAVSPDGKVEMHLRRREQSAIWITELTLRRTGAGGSTSKIRLPDGVARDRSPAPLRFCFSKDSQFVAATIEENFSRTVMLCDTTQAEMAFVALPEPNWIAMLSTRLHPLDDWHLTQEFDIAVKGCEFTGPSALLVTYIVVKNNNEERNYRFYYDCKTGANHAPRASSR